MIDITIQAPNENALIAALPFARGKDENGVAVWIQYTEDYALDIIRGGVFQSRGASPTYEIGLQANLRILNEDMFLSQTAPPIVRPAFINPASVRSTPLGPHHPAWA